MFLLNGNSREGSEPEVWSAHTAIDADAAEVLRALTDPELIATWAPVSFEVEDRCGMPARRLARARQRLGRRAESELRRARRARRPRPAGARRRGAGAPRRRLPFPRAVAAAS